MIYMMLLLLGVSEMNYSWSAQIHVSFEQLPSHKGELSYLLFANEKGFPDQDEKSIRKGSIILSEGVGSFEILNVSDGEYALSVIHDENSNNKLDTNFLGIPKEAFGFSNNPTIFMGPPDFEEASFKVKDQTKINIKMKTI